VRARIRTCVAYLDGFKSSDFTGVKSWTDFSYW
jgi:hypothetical protein